ncbi:hypothetical protein B4113_4027 [Geobacillus sp. B4113_201601]|nr:hypothetical protein B4113_4027 [Geobacillus sp. B4113_201601]
MAAGEQLFSLEDVPLFRANHLPRRDRTDEAFARPGTKTFRKFPFLFANL